MAMSFLSVLKKIGQDIEKVFTSTAFQKGLEVAEAVVGLAFPALGPAFNVTAQIVQQTEANFAAIGKAQGTGPEKLAAALAAGGNLVAQALKDSGVSNVNQQKVAEYFNAVVTILNSTPALTSSPPPS
jgi:hypothetical protein